MASISPTSHPVSSSLGEPAWELALLYPPQGQWSISEYLEITERTNQLVEFTSGKIEVLEMPTIEHQKIVGFLFMVLQAAAEGGLVLMGAASNDDHTGQDS